MQKLTPSTFLLSATLAAAPNVVQAMEDGGEINGNRAEMVKDGALASKALIASNRRQFSLVFGNPLNLYERATSEKPQTEVDDQSSKSLTDEVTLIAHTRSTIGPWSGLGTFSLSDSTFPKDEPPKDEEETQPPLPLPPSNIASPTITPYAISYPNNAIEPKRVAINKANISATGFVDIHNATLAPAIIPGNTVGFNPNLAQTGFLLQSNTAASFPLDFQVGLMAGSNVDIVAPAKQGNAADIFRYANRLNMVIKTREGLKVTIGKVAFPMGLEVDVAPSNNHESYGDHALSLPFSNTGVMITKEINPNHAVYGGILNGQQVLGGGISPLVIGGYRYKRNTLRLEGEGFVTSDTVLGNREKTKGAGELKVVYEGNRFEAKALLDLGFQLDASQQEVVQRWVTAGAFVKAKFTPRWSGAFRAELVHDPANLVSSTGASNHGNLTLTNDISLFGDRDSNRSFFSDIRLRGEVGVIYVGDSFAPQAIAAVVAKFGVRPTKH